MATKHGVNYRMGSFTAGTKNFNDRRALSNSLHPDISIGDATELADRLGYDLVLTHVPQTSENEVQPGEGRIPVTNVVIHRIEEQR